MIIALAGRRGRAMSFDDMLETAWGESTEAARASLEVIIARLRRKLDSGGETSMIRTMRGFGYSLRDERMTARSVTSQLSRTIIVASTAVTFVALLVGVLVGAGVVLREEDATSRGMVRVFQTEISHHASDFVVLDAEIRDEIVEQRSFGRQIEVWRGSERIGAAPEPRCCRLRLARRAMYV